MAEWDNDAKELTVLFSVDTKYWNSLNKTLQQKLVKDETETLGSRYGEVSKLKGYKIAAPDTAAEFLIGENNTDVVVVHSELWVIPNKEQRAVLDGA